MTLRVPLISLAVFLLFVPSAPADVTYSIDTYAGSDLVGDGGAATAAQLSNARGIAIDRQGNLYVSDTDNHRVRKITPAGIISTLAGTGHPGFSGDGGPAVGAQLNSPYGLAVDRAGNLYVADYGNERVRRISPDGGIVTVAGNGQKGSGGDGGPAIAAQLTSPRNLVLDSLGNLYVSEFEGHRVRRISGDGSIVTVAGTGVAGLNLDPKLASMSATTAQLNYPAGLAVDAYDAVYIADSGNNLVRKMWGGNITTALDGRTNPAFLLYSPTGIAIDAQGFLYVTDSSAYVRKVYAGQLMSVAGTGDVGYSGDGAFATSAHLTGPHDLAFDARSNLYIADGCYVRKVSGGMISTVAGNGYASGLGDNGPAAQALLVGPAGLALDAAGNLYVADTGTERVRKVDTHGIISTVAGNGQAGFAGDGGMAMSAALAGPASAAADAAGNVYVADTKNNRVRKVAASGIILTAAGSGLAALGLDNQFAPVVALNQPRGVAVDATGTIYVADTANHRVVRFTSQGSLITVAGTGIAGWSGDGGHATVAQLNAPEAVACDAAGNLYIADTFNHAIRKVTAAGIITTVAGDGTTGVLNYPGGVAVDSAGVLYIADTWNHRIRRLDPSGAIRTIAGVAMQGFAGDGGPALQAEMNYPSGIAVDGNGTVYFSDSFNNRVRRLTPQALPPPVEIAPQPIQMTLVNAASLLAGPVAPGERAAVFAAGVGPATGTAGSMATDVAGIEVRFDGTPAPLFYAQSGRIDVQVPYSVNGSTDVRLYVNGAPVSEMTAPVAASAPGIFAGSTVNQDGSQNGVGNPAAQGSTISIFATGEGMLGPAGQPVLPVALTIGGSGCDIVNATSAPGMVGMLQIDARVPQGATGVLPVVLTIGSASSQAGVTVVVQ